mgnify:CR=1 FL=1
MNRSLLAMLLVTLVGCTKTEDADTGDDWGDEGGDEGGDVDAPDDDGGTDGGGSTDGGTDGGTGGGGTDGGGSGGSTDGGSGGGSGTGEASGGEDPEGTDHELVDPDCIDGEYTESLPTPETDISSDLSSYSAASVNAFLYTALDKRWDTGRYILQGGHESDAFSGTDCIAAFLSDTSSGESVLRQASTLVHECGHFFDIGSGGFSDQVYHFTEDLSFTCEGGRTPENGGGETFARSLITGDEFSVLHPPCASFGGSGCDSYGYIYLDGDPTDGTFDSGDQGFGTLHEETLQYVHSLATGYAFNDHYSGSVSERDGILTFLWYTMRYLRMARLEHPDTYTLLSEDTCWRELILTTWGRAWLYLDATADLPQLGLDDEFIETLVREPVLLDEIDRLREIEGCE